ncbi:MAG: hypothetical protein H7124_02385 [Phycisphaerales bacterium]|nr:hypothetical protein [Hyphomonadaceae bacterium]
MTHLIDARALLDTFDDTDPRMPQIVFSLLRVYLDQGPFEFDATALAKRLSELNLAARVNAEQLASLQPQIERFFEQTPDGWSPRVGVLALDHDTAMSLAEHIPGEQLSRLT